MKVLLWCAALLTIGVLLTIVGFIVFRGLVSDRTTEDPVIGQGSIVLPLSGGAGDLTVVVNPGLRITDLTAPAVADLFSGEAQSWGDLSGQDIPVQVFLPAVTHLVPSSVQRTLLGGSTGWSAGAITVPDAYALLKKVAEAKGGIGWIPSEMLPADSASG